MLKDSVKTNYVLVDIFRVIFAIFVVMIHTQFLQIIGIDIVEWFGEHLFLRLAVPFFFIVSGFFVGNKLHTSKKSRFQIFKGYAINILPPLLVWQVLNLPFDIARYCEGQSIEEIVIYCIKTILFYPSGFMWFLQSCVFSVAFICVVWRSKYRYQVLVFFSAIIYIFVLLCDSYYFLGVENAYVAKLIRYYFRVFVSDRLLYGLPFITIGIILNKLIIKNEVKVIRHAKYMIIPFTILTIIETFMLYGKPLLYSSELMISYIGLAPCIVAIALSYKSDTHKHSYIVRKASTGIYYTHSLILELVVLVTNNVIIKFFLVMIGALITSYIFNKGKWTRRIV